MIKCTLCGGPHPRSKCPWPTPDEIAGAQHALDEWNKNYLGGGELPYPHWADDVIARHKLRKAA